MTCRCLAVGDWLLTSACDLHGEGSTTPEWVAGVADVLSLKEQRAQCASLWTPRPEEPNLTYARCQSRVDHMPPHEFFGITWTEHESSGYLKEAER